MQRLALSPRSRIVVGLILTLLCLCVCVSVGSPLLFLRPGTVQRPAQDADGEL